MKWLLAAFVLAAAEPALACKCAVVARDQVIASTPIVFEGRIASIGTRGKAQVTTLVVTRAIKGVPEGASVRVNSRTESAACGYDFREAPKTLMVGRTRSGGTLSVRRCAMVNLNP